MNILDAKDLYNQTITDNQIDISAKIIEIENKIKANILNKFIILDTNDISKAEADLLFDHFRKNGFFCIEIEKDSKWMIKWKNDYEKTDQMITDERFCLTDKQKDYIQKNCFTIIDQEKVIDPVKVLKYVQGLICEFRSK